MADHPLSPYALFIGLVQFTCFVAVVSALMGFFIGWLIYA